MLGIVNLKISMTGSQLSETVPFAVIENKLMPYCCILGSNFISMNEILVDFHNHMLECQDSNGNIVKYEFKFKNSTDTIRFLGVI